MKTNPMAHQLVGRERLRSSRYFALAAEQGTGKTWMMMDDMEWLKENGHADAALVIAPRGVHTNWVLREIPRHMSMDVKADYYLSGASKAKMAKIEAICESTSDAFRVLSINFDAFITKKGREIAERFMRSGKVAVYVDESSRIKNLSAKRTEAIIEVGKLAVVRRIASGTMISNNPLDLFAQFEFLKPEGKILGTTSYRSFVAEFAEVLPKDSAMVKKIMEERKLRYAPQIIARDALGRQKFKNLEKLRGMISPFTYRVLKSECLDLPEKIYQTAYYELTPQQTILYAELKQRLRFYKESGDLETFTKLTVSGKLQQILAGFIMFDGEVTKLMPFDENPRMQLLKEVVEDVEGQFIVWAHYREEIQQISDLLNSLGISNVQYHGGVSTKDREIAVDSIQNGSIRAFVGQPVAGGIGLTLTNAETTIYYSNSYNLEVRLQSEDRNHRIGTRNNVVYIDLCAAGTVDEKITNALQYKEDVAMAVMNNL